MSEHSQQIDAIRRGFLSLGGIALAGVSAPPLVPRFTLSEQDEDDDAAQAAGITRRTLIEAEKVAGVRYTDAERGMMLSGLGEEVQRYLRRRAFPLPNTLAPATTFDPRVPGVSVPRDAAPLVRTTADPGPLPADEEEIAFAPVTQLSRWIESKAMSSVRLTEIYLDRLKRFGPRLQCVATLTEALAMEQARRADAEIAAGRYRGPLHGIPWGAKDLFDTKGITTAWGAEPWRDRVPEADAAVVRMLTQAGAVLVAKLTLGALAYGDIWYGGRTNNPWNLKEGSSGSSAGSASATAAGLVGFSLGTETLGSIVSPSMRCGTTGLRPTFGRVPRTGAMALCWSLDKIGPITRTVEDAALVLHAINGFDGGDPSSIDAPFNFDATRDVKGMRFGYDPRWFEGRRATDIDRQALQAALDLGMAPVEIALPELPYDALLTILVAEAASAFEEMTLENLDDQLSWQAPEAWPNTFRAARFIPAIELTQANRFRRHVMGVMHGLFSGVDVMLGPSFADSMLLITNNTGHPSLTLRAGFPANGGPHGVTLWGRLFDEGTLCAVGMALEGVFGVWDRRPPL